MWIDRGRRTIRRWNRLYRELRMVALALRSDKHPVLAHVVVTRRCNLACTYCSEFDHFSKPVPTEELLQRIDHLARLGTTVVTLTGGEPLLHTDLETVVARIRARGMVAVMVTNGYLLTEDRIRRLNDAGLDRMQISVDNIEPDEVSKKSLKVLDLKLRRLARWADFEVNIHSVVGAGTRRPEDALTIAQRATELGLVSTVGIVHDDTGRLRPLNAEQRSVLERIDQLHKGLLSFAKYNPWRKNLTEGRPNEWHCGAGGRQLYVCENGLVHYCLAQRGYPAIPLAEYTRADVERESKAVKDCAPYCTIFCVQRIAMLDRLRTHPQETLVQLFPSRGASGKKAAVPLRVRLLAGAFQPSGRSGRDGFLTRAALRFLNVR